MRHASIEVEGIHYSDLIRRAKDAARTAGLGDDVVIDVHADLGLDGVALRFRVFSSSDAPPALAGASGTLGIVSVRRGACPTTAHPTGGSDGHHRT